MKMAKSKLRRIIKEELATINDETIEDTVMDVLSDEGGAAGLEPIESALEDLEDEDISLPDESIEDVIGSVAGVKRHADGDYVDTTKLEGRTMKITKRQLKRIIKEEKTKILMERTRASREGDLQREMADIMQALHEISTGMYGLVDPNAPGDTYGDELANDLDMQVKRLDDLYQKLEAYFVTVDDMTDRNPRRSIG